MALLALQGEWVQVFHTSVVLFEIVQADAFCFDG
jgi:hypothetical protein